MNAALRAAPACCRSVRNSTSSRSLHTACVATARGGAASTSSDDEAKRVRIAQNQLAAFETILAELAPHVTSRQLPGLLKEAVGQRKFNSSNRRLFRELSFTAIRFWPWIEAIREQLPPPPPPAPEGAASGSANLSDLRLGLSCAFLAGDTVEVRAVRRVFPALGWPAAGAGGGGGAADGNVEPERDLAETAALLQQAARVSLPPPEALAGPTWFASGAHWPDAAAGPNLRCMLSRPPVWIRVQTDDPLPIRRELETLGLTWEESAVLPGAWRVGTNGGGADLTETAAFASGLIEVQDLGSQMILGAAAVRPGAKWLDACAGAGGKTLQLARLLGPSGSIDALDVRQDALDELRRRAKRAGLAGRVRTAVQDSSGAAASTSVRGQFDGVLVDAPCTGSGTWRRSPHLRWQLQEADGRAMAEVQGSILRAQAGRVRPGGVLVYATCSLSHAENGAVVESFLASEQGRGFALFPLGNTFGFAPPGAHAMTVLPPRYDTDGFFVAQLQRKA